MSADTNAGGWPDAEKPGVPLNPEKDGWHWLQWPLSGLKMMLWEVEDGDAWWSMPGELEADDTMRADQFPRWGVTYLGPCLTPAEVAAREAAAFAAGAEAMKPIAFDAGREQGSDEAVAFEWGSLPTYTYAEALAAVEIPPMPGQPQGGAGDAG